jgi:DnaJ-class molecular chaperone
MSFAEINRIKWCRNHYEVLDVPSTANNEEIKAASRRILRLVHPDKNNHPEATEVTKRISSAKLGRRRKLHRSH